MKKASLMLILIVILMGMMIIGCSLHLIQTLTIETTVIGRTHTNGNFYLQLPNSAVIGTGLERPILPISQEAYENIRVGETYEFVIEVWTQGAGPIAVVKEYKRSVD